MENIRNQCITNPHLQWRSMEGNKERRSNQQNLRQHDKANTQNTPINTERMPIHRNRPHGPNYNCKKRRVNMHNRISNGNNQTLIALLQRTDPSSWAEENRAQAERIGLDKITLTTNKQTGKREITNKIKPAFKEDIERKGRDKSKVKFLIDGKNKWNPGHQPKYMKTLTRNEVSTIFKARTRMLDVKANYKNKYQDLQCRLCGKEDETQEHVLAKCEKTEQTKHQVHTEDIFTEDPRS